MPIRHGDPVVRDLLSPRRPAVPLAVASVLLLVVLAAFGNLGLPFERLTVLHGAGGSKTEFLDDDGVRDLLLEHHARVDVIRVGSREAARQDLDALDFIFPSGQPAADLALRERRAHDKYASARRPFVSPIVLATFRPYAEALRRAGAAVPQPRPDGGPPQYYTLDMSRFVGLMQSGRTWDGLGIRDFGTTNGNAVLAQTTDVCLSNSGATYLGLVAWAAGRGRVPDSVGEATAQAARIRPLLQGQGAPVRGPEELYFSPEGPEIAPVVVIYEHQYLAYQIARRNRAADIDRDRVLLYPDTSLQTEPTLIALNPEADRLGALIDTDPGFRDRAAELGFRVLDARSDYSSDLLTQLLTDKGVPVPSRVTGDTTGTTRAVLPDVPELEAMISEVGGC